MATQAQPTLTFDELGGRRRKVELSGRCAPEEIEFGIEQRNDLDWPQGSPDATCQIGGPQLKPITLSNIWRDRYMLGANPDGVARVGFNGQPGPQVASAETLAETFFEMCAHGQQIRLSWGRHVRYGIIHEFDWKPVRMKEGAGGTVHDISWTLEFVVTGMQSSPSPASLPAQTGVNSFASQLTDKAQTLRDLVDNPPEEIRNGDILSRVRDQVSLIEDRAQQAKDAVAGFTSSIMSASQSVRRTLGLAAASVSDARALVESTQEQVYRELNGYTDVAQATAGEGIAAAAWARQLGEEGGTVKSRAVEFRGESQQKLDFDTIATHRVRSGEDLYIISSKFYNTRDGWQRIMLYNGLDSPEVTVGLELLIPRASQQVST